jgi:hypothetical protein
MTFFEGGCRFTVSGGRMFGAAERDEFPQGAAKERSAGLAEDVSVKACLVRHH